MVKSKTVLYMGKKTQLHDCWPTQPHEQTWDAREELALLVFYVSLLGSSAVLGQRGTKLDLEEYCSY